MLSDCFHHLFQIFLYSRILPIIVPKQYFYPDATFPLEKDAMLFNIK